MKDPYQNAKFIKSITALSQAPYSAGEVAFVGRSNCGKSSLINVITNQKKIAKVSKTPGKTRQINFFSLKQDKFLVDLPGYGFAKVSHTMQNHWGHLIEDYLLKRSSLLMIFILLDSRRQLSDLDRLLIDFCFERKIAISFVGTKIDKLNQSQKAKFNNHLKNFLASQYDKQFDRIWLTSSLSHKGFEGILHQLDIVLKFEG